MQLNQFSKIFSLVILLSSVQSKALVDLRLTYGGLATKDFTSATCGTACSEVPPAIIPFTGAGADLIISPPLIPFGFGVRYEKIGITATAATVDVAASIERVSGILNYRIIDTILKIGPIFTVGISNKTNLKITESGSVKADYNSNKADSATAGLEIGIKPLIVIPLAIGVEAGYQHLNIKEAQDSLSINKKDIDLSGVYLKAYLGLSF